MSYALYVYLSDPEFPVDAWERIMTDVGLERATSQWRWRSAAAASIDVDVTRVDPASAMAPAGALWCVHVRSRHERDPLDAWRQLAVPYRALASLARVEVCDPEPWYPGSPRRFTNRKDFHRHASRIVAHLAPTEPLVERGLMSDGLLLLDLQT
ncbi:MAG: hypothetical protein R3A79_02085 [Nannocystaceae bacterium]